MKRKRVSDETGVQQCRYAGCRKPFSTVQALLLHGFQAHDTPHEWYCACCNRSIRTPSKKTAEDEIPTSSERNAKQKTSEHRNAISEIEHESRSCQRLHHRTSSENYPKRGRKGIRSY